MGENGWLGELWLIHKMEMQWPTSVWPIEMIIITHLKQFEVSKIWSHRATGIQYGWEALTGLW